MSAPKVRAVGLVPHRDREFAHELARSAANWFRDSGVEVRLPAEEARAAGLAELGVETDSFVKNLDLVISLGGDGTMLHAVDLVYPESVPINNLVQVQGTPLYGTEQLDPLEFVRTIAVARITMPTSYVRLSAGRQQMSEAVQALCFLAGANSIFYGDKLLTTPNPGPDEDVGLLRDAGLTAMAPAS